MKVSDFDYDLPPERIAQEPVSPRDSARLFVHRVAANASEHRAVADLPELLAAADLLVVNDTRVRRARLLGRRASGGAVELLLVERLSPGGWRALVKPAGRLRPDERVELEDGSLRARMVERLPEESGSPAGSWRVELEGASERDGGEGEAEQRIEAVGRMPLPPYIRRPRGEDRWRELDLESYQTIFARRPGATAAPTAGLHFTPRLVERLEARGTQVARVTLHVGEGTFRPVTCAEVEDHRMHAERFELGAECAQAVRACRGRGGRVVAVGTTSLRVLETCAREDGEVEPRAGETALFLFPGARFRAADALLTNFHLPRSTLLMLVAAFAGRERVLRLYREAIEAAYRFYSYGDAMLLFDRTPA